MQEFLKHREAYEYYYQLGESRNLKKVAEQFKVILTTAENWSKSFNWQERILLRDKKIADEVMSVTDTKIIDEKAKILNIVKEGITFFVKGLKPDRITTVKNKDGKDIQVFTPEVKVNTVDGFDKLVRLYLLLTGEATDRFGIEGDLRFKKNYRQELWDKIDPISGRLSLKHDEPDDESDINTDT